MKKTYSILGLIGVVIWSTAIFLRDTSLMNNDIIKQILGVTPNFGVVWIGISLMISFYPYVFKKEFNTKYIYSLIGIILVLLVVSETIHHFLLNSSFDVWDMVASLIASIVVVLISIFNK